MGRARRAGRVSGWGGRRGLGWVGWVGRGPHRSGLRLRLLSLLPLPLLPMPLLPLLPLALLRELATLLRVAALLVLLLVASLRARTYTARGEEARRVATRAGHGRCASAASRRDVHTWAGAVMRAASLGGRCGRQVWVGDAGGKFGCVSRGEPG